MSVPAGTPGADDGQSTTGADASAEVGSPAEPLSEDATREQSVPDASGQDGSDGSESQQTDDADLQQYPESVRDDFRALAPEKRKALYEEAEKRAEARITANRERTELLERQVAEQEQRRKEILARTGKHVGAEAQTIDLPNGARIELPSRADMVELSRTQRGRNELLDTYGLDEPSTEFWVGVLDRNREALDAAADLLDDQAWAKLDVSLQEGIQAEIGVDPSTILGRATSPRDVIKGVADHYKAQIAQLKKEHDARTEALNLNAEGMRGRVAAATSRSLATGGRTGGANGRIFTREDLRGMDNATYRANKAEIERQDREGLIR